MGENQNKNQNDNHKRVLIGEVNGRPFETITEPMPNFPRSRFCHIDVWHTECRMWLATNKGQFYAPPFESQTDMPSMVGQSRVFQTLVLREVFDTFKIDSAFLVDFKHNLITLSTAKDFGIVDAGEAVAFAISVLVSTIDPQEVLERRRLKREAKLAERQARGGRKTRSKRKRKKRS